MSQPTIIARCLKTDSTCSLTEEELQRFFDNREPQEWEIINMDKDKFTHPRDAEPDHEWQTRDGRAVRVLAHDVKNNTHPIAALVSYSNGDEWPISFEECGRLLARDESNVDLIDAPKTRTVWVNCYPSRGAIHETREIADKSAFKATREACVKLTYKVGEGL